MCPACLTAATLLTIGATSAGGIAVYATIKLSGRQNPRPPQKKEKNDE